MNGHIGFDDDVEPPCGEGEVIVAVPAEAGECDILGDILEEFPFFLIEENV